MGRAHQSGSIETRVVQIRDFSKTKHKTVDDTPYGGGPGMLIKVDVLHQAWKAATGFNSKQDMQESLRGSGKRALTVFLSPQGRVLDQAKAQSLATYDDIFFVCGHYEGVDQRFIDLCVDEELSIGDYVLTGGELPALVATDVVLRYCQGVVGDQESVQADSLSKSLGGLLKYPQYTKPALYEGMEVPPVLLSGNHAEIERWRKAQSLKNTQDKRPDLLSEKGAT